VPDATRIRNFAIIAHIDHGKSTLADRLIERTGALTGREMREQVLDSMDIERERGITIKAQTACLRYVDGDGVEYAFNLIDTPGHVDFTYEVSRSLSACEGALLVVDAAQGVEAQTLANVYLALDANLEIVPVINKVDLPSADPDGVLAQLRDGVGLDTANAVRCSAKTGLGIDDVLSAVARLIPPPGGLDDAPLRALIVDSWFDPYVGVVCLVRMVDGVVRVGDRIQLMATGARYEVGKLGVFRPTAESLPMLSRGQVGFLVANIRDIRDARVGDTVTTFVRPASQPLPGFKEAKPMVFSGIYPVDSNAHVHLRDALDKLRLNDASLTVEPDVSDALGLGFRVGFLGLLHMEITQERLEREYDLDLISSAPSVVYRVQKRNGDRLEIRSPSQLPPVGEIDFVEEPISRVTLHTPEAWVGAVLKLCTERRGRQVDFQVTAPGRVVLVYDIPYAEVVFDFFDKLKSASKGYASMDYEIREWKADDLVRVDILLNGDLVDALSVLCHRDQAYYKGGELARKLKEFIPRQMFEVAIQAAIGSKIIARTNVKALRKDVTAKCYGGDISRKRKLLERQKEGKKRMKAVGSVEIPQEAFLAVLRVGED
jgi:GTP-binding protein LepA